MQVKQLRRLLGDKAPECPKLDISVDTWDKILKLALGNDNWNSWGQKYSPYYDDVSFMIGVPHVILHYALESSGKPLRFIEGCT